jgi:hypothetical protein
LKLTLNVREEECMGEAGWTLARRVTKSPVLAPPSVARLPPCHFPLMTSLQSESRLHGGRQVADGICHAKQQPIVGIGAPHRL